MMSLRVVVTGRHGQLVRSMVERGAARSIEIVPIGRPVLELTDSRTIDSAISALNPQVVVNAAGYTDTEGAETEPDVAHAVNVDGAGAVAACARRLGVPIIHVSSSYVFDGLSAAPYREQDPIAPLGIYGKTKAWGEAAVAAAQPDHVILRTSLVFSPFGRNSLTSLLKRAEQQEEVRVVADQTVNPTAAADLAEGILTVALKLIQGARAPEHYGIFHLATREATTPANFASTLFAMSARLGGPSANVVRIASHELGSRVRRPLNSRLDCAKIAAVHGIEILRWEPQLRTSVERICSTVR
jgi:dTDP-4-dehydrorhamnose reductase